MNVAVGRAETAQGDEQKRPPWERTIPEVKDVIVGELAERGEWIVANIDATSSWPINSQKVTYRGDVFWIMPIMRGYFPAVAMKIPARLNRAQCEKLMMRFVSMLAWVEDAGFMVEGIGGGNLPRPMGRDKEHGFSICDEFDLSYFPEPNDPKALLALALMREGRGLNHPAYGFLSFFRVLDVAFPGPKAAVAWISASVASLRDHQAGKALAELTATGVTDIGQHLYASGRCAVAHANRDPIVDPDDPVDIRRMYSELPIMRALAQRAIEEVRGGETSHTVYDKHLYELAGFKKILGADTVDHLVRGVPITDGGTVEIPDISVLIRRCEPHDP